jgi:hypothetical protein
MIEEEYEVREEHVGNVTGTPVICVDSKENQGDE